MFITATTYFILTGVAMEYVEEKHELRVMSKALGYTDGSGGSSCRVAAAVSEQLTQATHISKQIHIHVAFYFSISPLTHLISLRCRVGQVGALDGAIAA